MKTLLLVRHAKSSWEHPGTSDHDRPLNERGLRDAPAMGHRLAERGVAPDVILSSTAVRARATAELIAAALGFGAARVITDERLYGASADEVLRVIGELDNEVACAIVVGHNPETASLAHQFSDEIHEMPTSAVAEFTFDVDAWYELDGASPVDVLVESPRR
ncbi:SixA phosphatase family protein [Agromyces sp. NPDC058484]|uniref:SixA phosphatase family protein n=1 Tax=Agromyces sp. NPDC058484 TaxID=3346524 RepID=UPI003663EE73